MPLVKFTVLFVSFFNMAAAGAAPHSRKFPFEFKRICPEVGTLMAQNAKTMDVHQQSIDTYEKVRDSKGAFGGF